MEFLAPTAGDPRRTFAEMLIAVNRLRRGALTHSRCSSDRYGGQGHRRARHGGCRIPYHDARRVDHRYGDHGGGQSAGFLAGSRDERGMPRLRPGVDPGAQPLSSATAGPRDYACDATQPAQVTALFAAIAAELGQPDLVVFNVGTWDRGGILEISDTLFEQAWRTGCFGGFLVTGRPLLPCCRVEAAASSSVARPPRSAAEQDSPPSQCRNSACARWPRAWPASSAPKASMSPMSSSMG